MLILTRKKGEKIFIGDDIVIEVKSFENYKNVRQVQLGINAPKEIRITRCEKIRKQTNDSDRTAT